MKFSLAGRLWSQPDFLKLWAGETVSQIGSQVTQLALPTVAILLLHAGPFEVGLLAALEFLAFPTLGLVAGVWADRLRRRPIMITADLGRMLALASIPLAFSVNLLTLSQLYVVALITGIFTVFFDVSYQSYLPALIERPNLLEGNSKLEVTRSVAQVTGPAVAGFLIQLAGGARAILVDAVSFLASALAIVSIRKPEPEPRPATAEGRAGFFQELGEGVHLVLGSPVLRTIAGCTATSNLGSNMSVAVFLIFAYRHLSLAPAVVGIVFGLSSLGGLFGALVAAPVARRLGLGRTLALSSVVGGLSLVATPLALVAAPALVLSGLGVVGSATTPLYNINQVSLRQAITPDRVQGRMNATMRTIVWGTIPIGSFVGGILGAHVGVVQTILLGGAVRFSAGAWILGGPAIHLKEQPAPVSA